MFTKTATNFSILEVYIFFNSQNFPNLILSVVTQIRATCPITFLSNFEKFREMKILIEFVGTNFLEHAAGAILLSDWYFFVIRSVFGGGSLCLQLKGLFSR